jgi:Fe-S-cluster containining protein
MRTWRRAGRTDLLSQAYTRRSKGEVVLRLTANGRCMHLGRGNRCGIYPLRPANCSVFPVGAEPCLSAREETLGIID